MKQVYRKRFKKDASTVVGPVFTITWARLKDHIEGANHGRLGRIVSIRADENGLNVFSEGGDNSAWSPKI